MIKNILFAIGAVLLMGAAGSNDCPSAMDIPLTDILTVCVAGVVLMLPKGLEAAREV